MLWRGGRSLQSRHHHNSCMLLYLSLPPTHRIECRHPRDDVAIVCAPTVPLCNFTTRKWLRQAFFNRPSLKLFSHRLLLLCSASKQIVKKVYATRGRWKSTKWHFINLRHWLDYCVSSTSLLVSVFYSVIYRPLINTPPSGSFLICLFIDFYFPFSLFIYYLFCHFCSIYPSLYLVVPTHPFQSPSLNAAAVK